MRESHRWICNSWERGTESEANAPEDGRILNRVYENNYLGDTDGKQAISWPDWRDKTALRFPLADRPTGAWNWIDWS
jgi:hypothetical protein